MRWTGEQAPPPLPPPRKRIGFPAEILLIESREGCGPLEHTRRRRGRIPLRTTLSQIPLKSFGFPGAESARKRFFLRGQAPPAKKSAPGGDQAKSKISLGRSRSDLLALWASNLSAAQVAGLDWKSRGFTPSRALPGLFWWRFWFPTKQACSFVDVVSDDTGRGARCSPTSPRVTEFERAARPLALSSVGDERRFLDGQGRFCSLAFFYCCSGEGFCFRRRGGGALRSPTPPRVTGCERAARPLALSSVGDERRFFVWARGVLFFCFFYCCSGEELRFQRHERGALRSPTPPRGRGARGFRPSRALPGLFWWEIRFPSIQVILAIYLRPHGTHWGSGVVAFDQYGACTLTYFSTPDGSRGNTGEVSGLAEMAVRVGARVSLGASFLTEHRIYP